MRTPSDSVDDQLARIQGKLIAAREHDRRCTRFGAATHQYQLGSILRPHQMVTFESDIGWMLPEGFRRFLLELGNGGAGPAYGWPAVVPEAPLYRQAAWRKAFETPLAEELEGDPAGSIALSNHGCGIFDFVVVNGREGGNVWFSGDTSDVYPLPGKDFDSLHGAQPKDFGSEAWRGRLADPANTSRISFLEYYEQWLDEVLADAKLVR